MNSYRVLRDRFRVGIALLVALLALVGAVLACSRLLPSQEPVAIWTPAPLTTADLSPQPAILPPNMGGLPTITPRGQTVTVPTTRPPAGTTVPTVPSPAGPTATSAVGQLVVITEADIVQAIASGATAQSGLVVEGLDVHFGDDQIRLRAEALSYGVIQVRDLELVGRLVARDGLVHLETESISPGGLVTALIPLMADQALQQFGAQWYVEEVRLSDGRLELRVR